MPDRYCEVDAGAAGRPRGGDGTAADEPGVSAAVRVVDQLHCDAVRLRGGDGGKRFGSCNCLIIDGNAKCFQLYKRLIKTDFEVFLSF